MATFPSHLQRYHSMDALRATMMALGLILHSAVNYMESSTRVWPIKDSSRHITFDLLFYFIHLFRMPVFFVSAGFFAALLYERRGRKGMLKNRVQRVLIPLILSFILIMPLFKTSVAFAMKGGGKEGFREVMEMFSSFSIVSMHLGHLWFLYYLFLLYLAALMCLPLLRRLKRVVPVRLKQFLSRQLTYAGALPVLSLLTFITLVPMSGAELDTFTSFIPAPHVLLAYSVFFAYGWLLYRQRQSLKPLKDRWKIYTIAGCMLSALYLFILLEKPFADHLYAHLFDKGLAAIAMWGTIYASIGLFERFFSKPNAIVRYLSDASYWMYLVHLPVSIYMVGLLAGLALPAFVKFFIVLSTTLAFTLITYHYLVRATFVGLILNGKRYSRALLPKVPEPA